MLVKTEFEAEYNVGVVLCKLLFLFNGVLFSLVRVKMLNTFFLACKKYDFCASFRKSLLICHNVKKIMAVSLTLLADPRMLRSSFSRRLNAFLGFLY
ncbi:unknown protein [Desulfotalea psychrophila LSv54]|uniref:Uncharacterized protein n=1 Tax=Desulfotalea psychrophila (strain LSv54 / DSM 12343) TaxID=177439 RepID=Q6AJV7_DESPS|nr:unknown protein [Desulfotalea psychrophila LSv54]